METVGGQGYTASGVRVSRLSSSEVSAVAREDRFDFFVEESKKMGDPLDSFPLGEPRGGFAGGLELVSSARTSILRREAEAMRRVYSHNDYPGFGNEETLWLFATTSGGGVVECGRSQYRLNRKNIYLVLHNKPHVVLYQMRHRFLGVEIPLEALSLSRSDLDRFEFAELGLDRAVASHFFTAVRSILDLGHLDAGGMDSYMIGLAELVLRTALGVDPDHAVSVTARRKQIEHYIKSHATDPNFSVDRMAVALRISRRRIYQIFETGTETLGDVLQRCRMQNAEQLLVHGAGVRLSIEEIAKASGFGSSRTMARAFQKVHGISPSEYGYMGARVAELSAN